MKLLRRCIEVLRSKPYVCYDNNLDGCDVLFRSAQPSRHQHGIDPVLGDCQVRAIYEDTYIDLNMLVVSSSDSQLLVVF